VNIRIAYGKTGLEIRLPDDLNVKVVEPKYVKGLPDQAGAVRDVLRKPIGTQPLSALVKPSDKVGIVFNDITRPTPYHIILPILLEEIGCVPDRQVTLFNAVGTHRPNTEAELRGMLGDKIVDRFRIVQNDAGDRNSHVMVGKSKSGNEIRIHRELVECDVKILTGFIEPHFFAGFSGGGKACMPGLAMLSTIFGNHSAVHISSPKASWGKTTGNPIWEGVREAALMVQPMFLLNVTLNKDKQITAVFAGDVEKAHSKGCAFVKGNAMVAVKEPFDIVISSNSGYPLDMNLYQSVKGMSAASQIVKDGGSIIIAADCCEGIPEHGEYRKLLCGAEDAESLLETILTPGFQKQDMWQVQIHALICKKADVYFYSRNLSDEQIEGALLKPCRNIESTIDKLLGKYGRKASICVLPEGPQTIPYICRNNDRRSATDFTDERR
jgi:nickel-dependent lactate racemase